MALVAQIDGTGVEVERDGDALRDKATRSRFDLVGRCTDGPLAGKRLALAAGLSTRFYGFSQTYPATEVFAAPEEV